MRGLGFRIRLAAIALLMLGLAGPGCGEEEDPRPATWSYIWPTIIQPNCTTSGCHSRHTATFGLQLETPEGAYIDLVGNRFGGPNQPNPSSNWVIRGEPDRSTLLYLLRGERVGLRMPPDGPLPNPDIELIERWILEGAKYN